MMRIWTMLFVVVGCLLTVYAPVRGQAGQEDVQKIAGERVIEKDQFLDELAKRCFKFFWEKADEKTGLLPDRSAADGSENTKVSSSASTGFGLTAYCIGADRGWITREQAYERVRKTMVFLLRMEHEHGLFYHFKDMRTGKRVWKCELSNIDTALLMAGVLTAGEYFKGTEVERMANRLYERVDWDFLLREDNIFSMGWSPEGGLLKAKWGSYSELKILYLLAMGSKTHPSDPSVWDAWTRGPIYTYAGRTYLNCPPLFTHQYSQGYFDFRGKRDKYADYWMNSVLATGAQRQFCIDMSDQFPTWGENIWGLTASDGEHGYRAWGGPPAPLEPLDGTIVPCAAGGSVAMLPEACTDALYEMYLQYGDLIWKRYGFADAFNPQNGWVAKDVIGIDVGITLVMIANAQDEFVWKTFMGHEAAQRGMEKAGFVEIGEEREGFRENCSIYGLEELPLDKRPTIKAVRVGGEKKWTKFQSLNIKHPVSVRFAFSWDKDALIYDAVVKDPSLNVKKDKIELFVDAHNDGLVWRNKKDFQLIFEVKDKKWEWHGGERVKDVYAKVRGVSGGYKVYAKIPWTVLGIQPEQGMKIGVSPSVLNVAGQDHVEKLDWYFRHGSKNVELGELILE